MRLTANNFFKFYIFHPLNSQLDKKRDRAAALTATIALGIFAGLAHLLVRLFIYNKNFLAVSPAPHKTPPRTPHHSEEEYSGSTTETEPPYTWPFSPVSDQTL